MAGTEKKGPMMKWLKSHLLVVQSLLFVVHGTHETCFLHTPSLFCFTAECMIKSANKMI